MPFTSFRVAKISKPGYISQECIRLQVREDLRTLSCRWNGWLNLPMWYPMTRRAVPHHCIQGLGPLRILLYKGFLKIISLFIYYLFVFLSFLVPYFSSAISAAYGGSQAKGSIGAIAASLHQSHSNLGCKPHLQPTPQLTATLDP